MEAEDVTAADNTELVVLDKHGFLNVIVHVHVHVYMWCTVYVYMYVCTCISVQGSAMWMNENTQTHTHTLTCTPACHIGQDNMLAVRVHVQHNSLNDYLLHQYM